MFRITRMGINYRTVGTHRIYRPGGTDTFLISFVKSPFFMETEEGDTALITKPAFCFYEPGRYQHYYNAENVYVEDWLHFRPENEDALSFFEKAGIPFGHPVCLSDTADLTILFGLIDMEFREGGALRDAVCDGLLHTFLLKFSEERAAESRDMGRKTGCRQLLGDIRRSIYSYSEDSAKYRTVKELATEANLSLPYFQHLYREFFGVSPKEDIIESRIEYAEYLLMSGTLPIGEIARRAGYENAEHFSRQFRERTGMTPGSCRRGR